MGQGPFRRTVVCFKNQLIDPQKFTDNAAINSIETWVHFLVMWINKNNCILLLLYIYRRHKHNSNPIKSWRSDKRQSEPLNISTNNNNSSNNIKREKKMGVERNLIDVKCESMRNNCYSNIEYVTNFSSFKWILVLLLYILLYVLIAIIAVCSPNLLLMNTSCNLYMNLYHIFVLCFCLKTKMILDCSNNSRQCVCRFDNFSRHREVR